MPETTPVAAEPTDQTGPLDAGHTTTEYALAKWASIAGIALAVLSTVVDLVNKLQPVMPENQWITKVGVVAGTLVTLLTTIMYGSQRAALKSAALKAGAATPAGDPQAAVRG